MDTPQASPSDQLSVTVEPSGTSTKKPKKSRKNKIVGGSASVLQREYQLAGSQEISQNIGGSKQNPPTSPTRTSEESSRFNLDNGVEDQGLLPEAGNTKSSAKKEKRRSQKSNHDTHAEDHNKNGPVADSEMQQDSVDREDAGHKKKEKRKKGRKSISGEANEEDIDQPIVADVEMSDHQEAAMAISSVAKKKDRRKNRKSSKSHLESPGKEEIPQPKESESREHVTDAVERPKKKKKSTPEQSTALKAAVSDDGPQDEDESAQSIEKSNSAETGDDSIAEQFQLPKSNTGKRKKLQQSIEETAIRDPETQSHVSAESTLSQRKAKESIIKPKNPNANRAEAGDANSATLLNQFISAQKNPQLESESVAPASKALGKRATRDEPVGHQSKKRKQNDANLRNGDIRSMFSDDAPQLGGSGVAASKISQRMRLSLSNVDVADSSPAVKTSRSANEVMAGWTAGDRRSGSAGNNQESSDDGSEVEKQPGEASVARRKRYLPADEPSQVALKTQKQAKSKQSSGKKLGKATKDLSSEVKPQRSRNQSVTRSKDGNGRLDENQTKRIALAVESYRFGNNLEQSDVNRIIQGNALTDGKVFWDFMKSEVPDVPTRNLQSWCRRNFHNYAARGVWTAEQDEDLMQLFNRMPKKWSLIGAALNRLPDDCRDRWRNYLSVPNLEFGPWTLEEERQLKDAVKRCVDLIREFKRREGLLTPEEENDDVYHERDISWMRVSELMGLSRSHLQCYRKWKAIKKRERATTDDLVAERIVISNSLHHLKSCQAASKTLAAEKLQFLRAIRDSKAGAESKIDWRAIDEKLDRNHDAMEMRICLRGLMHNLQSHESKSLQENVRVLIKAFEKSAPHEPEGYLDLPFESTGFKKRTGRLKRSSLSENNSKLYDVGSSSSKPKMRQGILKQEESQWSSTSTANVDDGGLRDTIQGLNSAKEFIREAPATNPSRKSALSTERVTDSDIDDEAPTSAQKPPTKDKNFREPRSKMKTSSKNKGHRTARTMILEFANSDDVQMTDVQDDSNDEDSNDETSQSPQFHSGAGDLNGDDENDSSAYNHPPIDSDDDSEMQDSNEPQIPATPEYELREGHNKMRGQSAIFDESGQVDEMGEGNEEEDQLLMEDDEESLMDDMSDIPAKVVKTNAPGVNGE
ncbi:hypothetical protein DSL72_004982 [Monilinia vaccinii-corymbosi]|uniref:Myb-like domain-containing protein n=1 Tax=Monilinia vaccinii-corymbosi TaxID=61207 RepID=A0A8A3PEC3_9HELO|nr:hypothetical protein DSL72_004982 [Monilinia vaccinii-corymbosi]